MEMTPTPGRTIGRISRVPLRDVWRHEAYDFTGWLQDNLDVLNDVTDLELSDAEREQSAGAFSIDLVAQDRSGSTVIIENQLERSNHDHLGKLITYLTAIDAQVAIWIVADPRPEHVRALSWLNDAKDVRFYLLKVEAIRIGDSPPAPLLTVIVEPGESSHEVGEVKRQLAERHYERHEFWTQFIEFAKTRTKLHANLSPSYETWLGTGAGKAGLSFNYVVNQHASRAELYIDRGKDAGDENVAIFRRLFEKRNAIEEAFGEPLEWQQLESRRACRIAKPVAELGYRDKDCHEELFREMVDTMARLEKAFRPHIDEL